ncbi:MAG: baseplate J/gp47 family protein [Candidatus Saccharimonadales bacterium]
MADKDKDTIYVDVDDEITGVIDKLKNSDKKVVALVLPKRASVFQSIVNMKLLKRAADSSKKNMVLITSEAALLPLAGVAGVHVAKNLTSKPSIPIVPTGLQDDDSAITDTGETLDDQEPDPNTPVGELAAASGAKPSDEVETVKLDDGPVSDNELTPAGPKNFEAPAAAAAAAAKKEKRNKKLKVPNFERFRLALILLGVLIILLIGGFIFANATLPKATITVKTNATKVDTNLNLNLTTGASTLDAPNDTLPAKLVTEQKSYTASTVTTGQKNNGNKAAGNVTITNCGSGDATIPAGTGFSSGGNTYISQNDVNVPVSDFHGSNGPCKNNGQATVQVTAQNGGAGFNLPSGANFSISNSPSGLSAVGGTISGGTDNIVQSVNQNDINNAKAKINTNDPTVEQALINSLNQAGYDFAIKATYSPGTPTVTPSAAVGAVTNNVTVTETVIYTMFGVHRADLRVLVDDNINSQIDSSKQSILDDGINTATYSVNTSTPTTAQIAMSGVAIAGPHLDTASIKKIAAGQKPSDIQSQLRTNPNVTGVVVKLSPFWVSSVPKNSTRIKVIIAKPTTTLKASTNAGSQ